MNNKNVKGYLVILVSIIAVLMIMSTFSSAHETSDLNEMTVDQEESLTSNGELKEKVMYLHNRTGTVNNANGLLMNTTKDENLEITDWTYSSNIVYEWYMNPSLAGDFELRGNTTIDMWIDISEPDGQTNTLELYLDLYEVSPDGTETLIPQESGGYVVSEDTRTIFNEYSVSAEYDHNLSADSTLKAEFRIESSDNFRKRIAYGGSEYPSRLSVGTTTYIDLDPLVVLDSEFNESYDFRLDADDTTIHFNASVTDPFGGYDIRYVNLTLEGPEDTIYYREPMNRVTGNDTSFRSNYTFEWNYGGTPEGEYNVIVSAVDNTGYNYRYPDNPGDETYGGHIEEEERGFWIGAERYFVHFKAEDSTVNEMETALVSLYSNSTGELVAENFTAEDGITNISVSSGTYSIRVYWQDVMVNETEFEVTNNIPRSGPVELSCDVYYPEYKVVDVAGEPVNNANIFISHPNGSLLREITAPDGYVRMDQMAMGDYSLRTEWLGREVNNTEQYLDDNDELVIHSEIYYLDIHTMDTEEVPVPEVHVSIRFNDTQRVAESKLTDINGNLTVRLPGTRGEFSYDLEFQWRGVDVGQREDELLDQNRSITVELEIYYVDFQTLDDLGYELENTRLTVRNIETDTIANSGTTDSEGNINLRLPKGPHRITSTWRGIQVDVRDVEITGDEDLIDITCAVYHVDFFAEDSRGEAISDARVTVSHPTAGTLTSNVTGDTGDVSMRLPGAGLNIDVMWRGAMIYSETRNIDSSEEYLLDCDVFYLDLTVNDDMDEPLENANVYVYLGNSRIEDGTSMVNGSVPELRLPGVELDISVQWKNVEVYQGSILLSEDTSETLTTEVYHIDFLVHDDFEEPISDGRFRITHGDTILHSDVTSSEGRTFSRIPGGDNRVSLEWRGVTVYDGLNTFDSSEEMTILVEDVYHVTFQVVDSRQEPLENARMRFYTAGSRFETGVTGENGTVSIRVPTPVDQAGEISISISWRGVNVYEDNLTVDSHVMEQNPETLEAEVYYIDYYVVDYRDIPVENAKVIGRHSELPRDQDIITDKITNPEGYIEFRLPRGEQEFTVHWKNIVVHTQTIDLEEDVEITAESDIYYLDLTVMDDRDLPLEGAQVRVTYPDSQRLFISGYTDENGEIEIRIPASRWDIDVEWLKTSVSKSQHEVTAEEDSWSLDVNSEVYFLTVETLDNKGEALDDVRLKVTAEDHMWTGYTSDGKYEFRLPARDDYQVEASFRTTYLLTNVDLQEDQEITVMETGEEEVEFEEYPTPIYRTNLFFLILILIALIVILGYIYSKSDGGSETSEYLEEEEEQYDEEFKEEDEFKEEEFIEEEDELEEEPVEVEPDEGSLSDEDEEIWE
ncbi:MAG: hypothetical protein ACOC53_05565 [Candidatus Saliniplasma sp.]